MDGDKLRLRLEASDDGSYTQRIRAVGEATDLVVWTYNAERGNPFVQVSEEGAAVKAWTGDGYLHIIDRVTGELLDIKFVK